MGVTSPISRVVRALSSLTRTTPGGGSVSSTGTSATPRPADTNPSTVVNSLASKTIVGDNDAAAHSSSNIRRMPNSQSNVTKASFFTDSNVSEISEESGC